MRKVLFTGVLCITGLASVAAKEWKIDPTHSRVMFTVTHMLVSEVTGRFTRFDATLKQGKEDFAGSMLDATIQTTSVNTDNEMRDKDLRSDNFFSADKFPTITFQSTSFEKTGDDTYRIRGNLTIRDVTKEVTLDGTLLGTVTDPRGNHRVGFRATTTINRFDYGVTWDRKLDTGGLIVSKEVAITLSAEMVEQK